MDFKEKLTEYGFLHISDEASGGVWRRGEGDDALKVYAFEEVFYLQMPKSSQMKKKSFYYKSFLSVANLIEKHICLEIMRS